jgi:zinc transporter ZupT
VEEEEEDLSEVDAEIARNEAAARWDRLGQHASSVGSTLVREKSKTMKSKDALSMFLTKSTPEHHAMMKSVRGRKKRALLAMGATHQRTTYGSVESGAAGEDEDEEKKAKRVAEGMRLAYAMFLGLVVDGIPESILLGFLAAENSLSLVLVLSLFVANFPEAFSSASLMKEAGVPVWKIVGMWTALMLITGILAGLACAGLLYFAGDAIRTGEMPFHIAMCVAAVEGIAGGAMIACIAAVMLPEAFGRKHETNILMDSGFLCTAGFLCAVLIKVMGGVVTSDHLKDAGEKHPEEHLKHEHFIHPEAHFVDSWGYGVSNETVTSLLIHSLEHVIYPLFKA